MNLKNRFLLGIVALLMVCCTTVLASPFAKRVPFTQPDGTPITLWGQGDEFYAVFETLDGYTVVFSQQTRAYEYMQLSTDGEQFISTGVAVGQGDPAALGFKQHVRINPEAVRRQSAERFARWDQGMEITRRWTALKAERRLADLAAAKGGPQPAPPPSTTTGMKLGLTLLVDFSDAVRTIPQTEINNFCNGDSYTGSGNNGSVKKYYQDNSNNLLTYSNVVTIYIRVSLPKTNYNNTSIDEGTQGRMLLTDVLNAMMALPNYATEILPLFSGLTVDGSSRVLACNVLYAGSDSGVWAYGLWPHSWSLANPIALGNGKSVYNYQISNIGTSLALGTFCHENGHMLCGYPDIYDYDSDSIGGAGMFCLMDSGASDVNPPQICAYLKRAAGWATTIDFNSSSNFTASVSSAGTNFNKFYRYAKPGVPTEYFLVENRQRTGRDASLSASGIAVWHVDELGDHNNQSTNFNTSHLNYEVSLMQADNRWHFQDNKNSGDSQDLYYLRNNAVGYSNRFNDNTSPSARWWDGSASGILFHHFSASSTTMTIGVGAEGPVITGQPQSRTNFEGTAATFTVATTGTLPLSYQWRRDGTNLQDLANISGAATASLTLVNVSAADAAGYTVAVTNIAGAVTSAPPAVLVWLRPELQITRSGPQLLLSWLTNGSGFVLETSSNLSAGAVWQKVTCVVTLSSNRFWVTNSPGSNPAFYRLRQQTSIPVLTGMVLIPAGSFTMGDNFGESPNGFEIPVHTVYVSGVYMDQTLVTKELWDTVYAWAVENGYTFDNPGLGKAANHPVHSVSWFDAVKWCNARSQKASLAPVYYTDSPGTVVYKSGQLAPYAKWASSGYRLPTEAEWEKAARGGASGHRFPWADSDTISHSRANYNSTWSGGHPDFAYDINPTSGFHPAFNDGVFPLTSPVTYFAPNSYGLYDMAGNAFEWCWDWFDGAWYRMAGASEDDTLGPDSGTSRVVRGGQWGSTAFSDCVAHRNWNLPTVGNSFWWSFRCAKTP